jgi:mono/diheme cytochrome c family protein
MKIPCHGGLFMKKLFISIIGGAFFILPVFSPAIAQQQTGKAPDTKALFEKKCSTCHSVKKPTSAKKTQSEWNETVMRMKNKNGAPVSDEEAKTIIAFLAENYGK